MEYSTTPTTFCPWTIIGVEDKIKVEDTNGVEDITGVDATTEIIGICLDAVNINNIF